MSDADDKQQDGNTEVRVPCEVYSRVVGYLRPVSAWNDAKQQEFEDRVAFTVPKTPERA